MSYGERLMSWTYLSSPRNRGAQPGEPKSERSGRVHLGGSRGLVDSREGVAKTSYRVSAAYRRHDAQKQQLLPTGPIHDRPW